MVKIQDFSNEYVRLTIEIPAEEVASAEEREYKKIKEHVELPGFRKGNAPKNIIAGRFGNDVFLKEALSELVEDAYKKAVIEAEQQGVVISSAVPDINIKQASSGKPVIFDALAVKKPVVELGDYKNIELDEENFAYKVTEEDFETYIREVMRKYADIVTVTDRPVKEGDTVNIDYLGRMAGKPFEGGESKGFDLTIGSNIFIPGFEEKLIGLNTGDIKELDLVFPDDYQPPEMAGKPVVFTVTVNEIKEIVYPEMNDGFARTRLGFDTFEEYKKDALQRIEDKKAVEAKNARAQAILNALIMRSDLAVPEVLVLKEAQELVGEFERQMFESGVDIDQFMMYNNMSRDQMINAYMEPAEMQIRARLVLEEFAKAEGIQAPANELMQKAFERLVEINSNE